MLKNDSLFIQNLNLTCILYFSLLNLVTPSREAEGVLKLGGSVPQRTGHCLAQWPWSDALPEHPQDSVVLDSEGALGFGIVHTWV